MSLKLALFFCLVAVACADRPYLGFRIPGDNISSRITGGEDADKSEFPHQISLQYGYPPYLSHLCGGSIISPHWILTAAHCPLAVSSTLYVKAGKHSLRTVEKTEQIQKVVQRFVHEKYPGGVAPYDIALLKLEKPLLFDEHVHAIDLPKKDHVVDGEVVLSGWGSTSTSHIPSMPDTLQKIKLPIVDLHTCRESIERLTGPAPLAETNYCTGPLSGGISACSGDSGGPLMKHENGKSEVIGIVSWGIVPCGTKGAPSVYTRVSAYIDWIESTMANN